MIFMLIICSKTKETKISEITFQRAYFEAPGMDCRSKPSASVLGAHFKRHQHCISARRLSKRHHHTVPSRAPASQLGELLRTLSDISAGLGYISELSVSPLNPSHATPEVTAPFPGQG